ncbi:uncharacterized protein LOC109045035 [Cyprinus carpio]|uniref:Uncharacterized protein LOC109045035 n=1 Tax=Cyprinus carpio TaxID=7962 RepID=A0A9Q9W5N5_CYPCA|nr:uncharacterized protein LOC109045035 [Cyprinus carpio]
MALRVRGRHYGLKAAEIVSASLRATQPNCEEDGQAVKTQAVFCNKLQKLPVHQKRFGISSISKGCTKVCHVPPPSKHRTYRVCSAHFHSSQFKRPSDVHGGLKWDAVPTKIEASNPPPPLDVERKRKPPKTRQELPRKKRKQSHVPPPSEDQHTGEAVVGPSSWAQCTEEAVAGPSTMEEGDIEDVSVAPSSVQRHVRTAAVREHSLTMKIRDLKNQVSKLRSKVKQLRQTKVSRAGDKERVMKELQRLLPAKAFAHTITHVTRFVRRLQVEQLG